MEISDRVDKCYQILNGYIIDMELWGDPSKYKNWLAIIVLAPTQKGGLQRAFLDRMRGGLPGYEAGPLRPHDVIEWGSDERSLGKDYIRRRVYQVVIERSAEILRCRQFAGAMDALKAKIKFDVSDPVDTGPNLRSFNL